MTKKFFAFFLVAGALVSFLNMHTVHAAEMYAGDMYTLERDSVVRNDLYVASERFVHAGTTTGDVLVLTSEGELAGNVGDDAFLAGGTLEIDGEVKGSVRAMGGMVIVRGVVSGDVVVLAGTLVVEKGARIGGDVVGYAEEAQVRGAVDGSLRLRAQQITLAGVVRGDTALTARESLVVVSGAEVHGALRYSAPREAEVQEGARLLGERIFTPLVSTTFSYAHTLFAFLLQALTFFFGAYVLARFFPHTVLSLEERVFSSGAGAVFAGLGVFIAFPLLAVFFFVTGVGMVVGGLLFATFLMLTAIALSLVPLFLGTACARVSEGVRAKGQTFLEKRMARLAPLLHAHPERGVFWIFVGALLTALLTHLSFIGWTVYALFFFVGFFALVRRGIFYAREQQQKQAE